MVGCCKSPEPSHLFASSESLCSIVQNLSMLLLSITPRKSSPPCFLLWVQVCFCPFLVPLCHSESHKLHNASTVIDPVPQGVLHSKGLQLSTQRTIFHCRVLQPLQHLHEDFEEERGEGSVLWHAALGSAARDLFIHTSGIPERTGQMQAVAHAAQTRSPPTPSDRGSLR